MESFSQFGLTSALRDGYCSSAPLFSGPLPSYTGRELSGRLFYEFNRQ